ncbi:DNA-protecting protein DprA [Elizabethkingia anophelis]|uniref:Rossmann fold nucleotide-binding protein Smf possibly involved in DNA uptake n=1 Tax=Elizabethkingia anophelis NUHP1 TaxID=1338011 RepID=A0A077ECP9_9FLAO|nr:DNA-processing protein DprA [Elizabethkingia anophelis]AIL43899.1 Rossmann fold nucleotide-binding protein Smf possibly involved in DNA uptake [Elizabethkingia anophelis NUHP1]AQW90463.1 DNA protecting protein DprA [Elizabethkingia anophelis]EQB92590.1 DNA processing protein DprA [Elizabethkingia anophelis 502]KUY25353.1 DNA processing protein DprA [Elizabethkingia anophelis]MBE9395241.1 DNA-protecting protein DprA [Elizabethkingia anophelis]
MFSEEHLYSIALRHCPQIGDLHFKKIVTTIGSAKEAWSLPRRELVKLYGIGNKIVEDIGKDSHLQFAERELEFCYKNNIQILLSHQGNFPELLYQCDDTPAILYQKGKFDHHRTNISIVGTRKNSKYGKEFITEFLYSLKDNNIQTISGLAIGTDTCAHEESLKNNIPTTAILAHGFHILYPNTNRKLADKLLENGGCLFTEFNSSQPPIRESFIQRNRIIAGISPSTIITETAYGGGSVSTANFASIYNREVLALPGSVNDKYSQGCNLLISQNKARIIVSISDTIDYLGLVTKPVEQLPLFHKKEILASLTSDQQLILSAITDSPNINPDEIAEKVSLPIYKILPIILDLELLGYIKASSGRQYFPS